MPLSFKKLILLCTLIQCASSSGLPAQTMSSPILSVGQQIAGAQKEVLLLYKNLVSEGYLERLGLARAEAAFDVVQHSEFLLQLLALLEPRDDAASRQLLATINKLFYLKFHQLVSHIDKERCGQPVLLINHLRTMYTHQVGQTFPFQTMLSQIMLQLSIVHSEAPSHQARCQTMLLVLQWAQESFTQINNSLAPDKKVDTQIIRGLLDGLMRHVLAPEKESFFAAHQGKIITAIIVIIVMVVGYYLGKSLIQKLNKATDALNNAIPVINQAIPVINQANTVIQRLHESIDVLVGIIEKSPLNFFGFFNHS